MMFSTNYHMDKKAELKRYCEQFCSGNISIEEFHQKYGQLFNVLERTKIKLPDGQKYTMPPPPLQFKINNTECYPLFFPIEMKNKHYIFDLLDILREGLIPIIKLIKEKCPRIGDPEGDDVYYILKWLKYNFDIWFPIMRNGISMDLVKTPIFNLFQLRNSINHQNETVKHDRRGILKTVSTKNVDQCFQDSLRLLTNIASLLGRDSIEYVQDNLIRLDKQFQAHHLWKKQRKIIIREQESQNIKTQIQTQVNISAVSNVSPVEQITNLTGITNNRIIISENYKRLLETLPIKCENLDGITIIKEKITSVIQKARFSGKYNFECSSSETCKEYCNYIFISNQNNELEYRLKLTSNITISTINFDCSLKRIRIFKNNLYLLYENYIIIFKLNNFILPNNNVIYERKIDIIGKEHLFAISVENDFIFVLPTKGKEKYILYWYRISSGELIKTIDILKYGNIVVNFLRIIKNRIIVADESYIYINEFDLELNFNTLYKIKRFISDSLLTITKGYLLVEIVKKVDGLGRFIVYDIHEDIHLYSFPTLSKIKIDGFFYIKNHLFTWNSYNNQLTIYDHDIFNYTENIFIQINLERDTVVEDLHLNLQNKILIYKTKSNNKMKMNEFHFD